MENFLPKNILSTHINLNDNTSAGIECVDHPAFSDKTQRASIDLERESYFIDVSRARTFGFVKQLEMLQKQNLALGASLKNAIGLDEASVLNPEGLRYNNEFAMRKILDAIGDLHLFGSTIQGRFEGYCSGHRMNKLLLDKLVSSGRTDDDAYWLTLFRNREYQWSNNLMIAVLVYCYCLVSMLELVLIFRSPLI